MNKFFRVNWPLFLALMLSVFFAFVNANNQRHAENEIRMLRGKLSDITRECIRQMPVSARKQVGGQR